MSEQGVPRAAIEAVPYNWPSMPLDEIRRLTKAGAGDFTGTEMG